MQARNHLSRLDAGALRRLGAIAALLALAISVALTLGSATAHAAFPGLNGRIACSGNRGPDLPDPPPTTGLSRQEIFSINPDGSGENVLTNNQRADLDPVYSPDGTKIAFASARDTVAGEPSNTEIYVANNDGDLEGPDVHRLTYNKGQIIATGALNGVAATDVSPSWSPDGKQIVFHSGRDTTFPSGAGGLNRFEIYKISATPGTPGVEEPVTRLTENRVQDAAPEWSPDGTKIVYQSLQDAGSNPFDLDIFTMNPDGTGKTNITNAHATTVMSAALDNFPTWSPDSQHIAFASSRDTLNEGITPTEVYTMNRNGTNQRRLTAHTIPDSDVNDRDFDSAPHWSPDGRRILFNSGRESSPTADPADKFVIFTMDANAGEAAGLQRVGETLIFGNCSWQSLPRPAATPLRPYALPFPLFVDCPSASVHMLRGTSGNDNLTGTGAGDRIFAGDGNDMARGVDGDDCIDLGPGADTGDGGPGNDLLLGGLGNDRITGSTGRDVINGNPDDDRLDGGSGGDRVSGDAGNDVVSGASGNDRLHGVSGNDRVSGGSGRDRINGGAGKDRVSGGSSGDRMAGDQGNDRISGNSGNDLLKGNSGADRINGGSGRDRISGGIGNDRITARDGKRDKIACGKGRDTVTADRVDRVSRDCERVRRR
jgi:Tol biopolymer transport system component